MDTTDFEDVLREACGRAGQDADNISMESFVALRRFAKRRLETAWRFHYWPDLGKCEQRFYRLPYSANSSYAQAVAEVDNSANEVWWPLTGQYFVALQAIPAQTTITLTNGSPNQVTWTLTGASGPSVLVQASGAPDLTVTGIWTGLAFNDGFKNGTFNNPDGNNFEWDGDTLNPTALPPQPSYPPTDNQGNINLAYWGLTAQYDIQPDPTGELIDWPNNPPYPNPVINQPPFDPTVPYVQGQRVQYAGNVYQLFAVGPVTGDLPTDNTQWGLVPPFDAYVPYEQSGQIPFTVVEGVFSANPRTTTRGNTLNYFLSERGVQVMTAISFAWIQYRLRCPKLTGNQFRIDAAYAVGQEMYYSDTNTPGNFYSAMVATNAGDSPISTPAKWCVVKLPRIFHQYLVLGMAADWMASLSGNDEAKEQMSAAVAEEAMEELGEVKSLYVGQMGQRVKTEVRTR